MFTETLLLLNNNKILWGVTMLLLNIGSRHVVADLGTSHEKLLKNEFIKKIIVFSMFFVATRDIIVSFLLAVLYVILIDGIFHEKRRFSVVSQEHKKQSEGDNTESDTNLSVYDEYIRNIQMLKNMNTL